MQRSLDVDKCDNDETIELLVMVRVRGRCRILVYRGVLNAEYACISEIMI